MKKIAIATCVAGGAAVVSSLCGGVAAAATAAQPTTTVAAPAPKQDDDSKMNTAQREAARKSMEVDLESTSGKLGDTIHFSVLTCGDTTVQSPVGVVKKDGLSTGDYEHYKMKITYVLPGRYPIDASCLKKDGTQLNRTVYFTVLDTGVPPRGRKVVRLPGSATIRNGEAIEFVADCAAAHRGGISSSNPAMKRALDGMPANELDETPYRLANSGMLDDAPNGTYPVYFTCGAHKISGTVTVGSPKSAAKPESNSSGSQQVSVKPVGAADTGDGTEAAQPDSNWLLIGGVGIAGLAGASAFALRRKSLR